MKLHILSDLHTEFADFDPPNTDADIVILAGDIGVGTGGIEWASRQYPEAPVLYIPGNHEYYGHDIRDTSLLSAAAPANVQVLNDDACELDNVRFLGTTLWTDFRLYGEGESRSSRETARRLIEDFASIRCGGRLFTPEDSVALHEASKAWLVRELKKDFKGPTVVVTHHLPASPSVAEKYKNDPLNPAFASRLESVIEKYQPELWIHGHTHVACDYEIFGTRVVCNPHGYPSESLGEGFSPGLVVEI
ncbi:MAG: metallophosphoesterase [Gammaproteobacteria bacterium]|nr:metallophosphoesterase [Gammaproteobacteria bacterium]